MTDAAPVDAALTVGQVAERFGVTVRTLHHYDEIGLVHPHRTAAGYRLYTDTDLERLRHVVVYRRLGFPLEEIGPLLDDPHADVEAHLRRQRAAVVSRLDELHGLVEAIDRALEARRSGMALTPQEQKELFGDGFSDDHAREAQDRWGDTEAWRQSQRRTSQYTKDDWRRIAAEGEEVTARFVGLKRAGTPADTPAAMDAAEAHRAQIERWFYDVDHRMHRCLGDMYVADPRFTKTYDDREPGLAAYVRDAIHANADLHEQA
jgi:MerR family transcriptional regulator, thiopeptide resistance regulator